MRTTLVGEGAVSEGELEADQKALERFLNLKQTEQDRRLRNIELQKKTLTAQQD